MSLYPPLAIGSKVCFHYNGPIPTTIDPEIVARSGSDCEISGIITEGDDTLSPSDRCEEGCSYVYKIKFPDGFETDAFEDEILTF